MGTEYRLSTDFLSASEEQHVCSRLRALLVHWVDASLSSTLGVLVRALLAHARDGRRCLKVVLQQEGIEHNTLLVTALQNPSFHTRSLQVHTHLHILLLLLELPLAIREPVYSLPTHRALCALLTPMHAHTTVHIPQMMQRIDGIMQAMHATIL